MSIISLFFQGEYAQLLLSAVALLIVFYALGRIVQRYFRFNKSNTFISIPLGMLLFTIINQIVYAPVIVTGLGQDILKIVDTLKALAIILFIFISYEDWFIMPSRLGLKTVTYSILSIGFSVGVYATMAFVFPEWFSVVNEEWILGVQSIFDGGNTSDNPWISVVNSYQSMYYWLYLNSSFGELDLVKVVNIQVALVWIISVTLAIQSGIVNNEKTIISFIASTAISVVQVLVLGYISPTNDLFYIMVTATIVVMLLYDYTRRSVPSENIILMTLFASLAFITIGSNSFTYFAIFGLTAITLSAIRGGNIVSHTISYLMLTAGIFTYYIISLTLHDIAYIRTIILYILLLAVILILMLLPLYSIGYNPSRRGELVDFEKSIHTRIGTGFAITALVTTLLSIFIGLTNDNAFLEQLRIYFIEFNGFGSSVLLGVVLYFSIILIPSIIIIVLWHFGKSNTLLCLFAFINILLNPINISIMCEILNIEFKGEIILIPSMMIISIFIINEITKRVPSLH